MVAAILAVVLAPESFYFTTTTGNSATLFREFGRLATWWGLSVGLVNLTGHYAAFNLAGPAAREVLRTPRSIFPTRPFPIWHCARRRSPVLRAGSCV